MTVYELETPIPRDDVLKLRVGDLIYITGSIVTLRDRAAARLAKLRASELPFPITGLPLFHCGPLARRVGNRWEIIAAGPTTSTRMEPFQADIIRRFGVRVIVGKGGMGRRTARALRKHGAVYALFTGGAALLAAQAIREVRGVRWLDLGTPEALWLLRVARFGPCLVAMDSHGGNLFQQVIDKAKSRKARSD